MPRTYGKKWIPPKKDIAAGLEALRATAPTPEARANVERFIERTGGMPAQRDTTPASKRNTGNETAGREYEALTRAYLRSRGYTVVKSEASQGAGDLVAVGARGTRFIQVKSVSTYTPGCANAGLREVLGLGKFKNVQVAEGTTRECWVWMRGIRNTPLVRVVVDHAGQVRVSGQPAQEVVKEVQRMLEAWGWQG